MAPSKPGSFEPGKTTEDRQALIRAVARLISDWQISGTETHSELAANILDRIIPIKRDGETPKQRLERRLNP